MTRVQSLPKQPPHSNEAEQSVLGGLLLNNAIYFDLADKLSADDFYRADHQMIYRGIAEMVGANKACDFVTLTEYFRNKGKLEDAGGGAYLASLAVDTYSIGNVKAYAAIVRERGVLRNLIAAGSLIGDLGYRPEGRQPSELLDLAEQMVFKLRGEQLRTQSGPVHLKQFVKEAEVAIEAAHRAGEMVGGLTTGLSELDNKLNGLQPGDLVVIAARPGLGKTSLAMTIAEYVAIDLNEPVMFFSMEMTGAQLAMRSLAGISQVSLSHMRSGKLEGDEEWMKIVRASARLSEAPIYVDPTGSLSPLELRARARRHKSRHGLALIVVDYVQLMKIPGFRERREQEIGEISRSMKALAKELGLPILMLSQLNRDNEKEGRVPRLSDLRDSGSIEQDADVVLFIHRDEKNMKNDTAQIIVGKQRNGPPGSIDVDFIGAHCRFQNISPLKDLPLPEGKPPAHGFDRFEK